MEEKDIKQQFHLLQKEVETAGARLEDTRLTWSPSTRSGSNSRS
jgi:hypothetical protein